MNPDSIEWHVALVLVQHPYLCVFEIHVKMLQSIVLLHEGDIVKQMHELEITSCEFFQLSGSQCTATTSQHFLDL